MTHGSWDKEEGNPTLKWEERRSRTIPGPQYDLDRSWNYIEPATGPGCLGQARRRSSSPTPRLFSADFFCPSFPVLLERAPAERGGGRARVLTSSSVCNAEAAPV